jgi:hypothetical protein
LQSLPRRKELISVKLCPRKNGAFLASRKKSRDQFDRIERIDSDMLLIIRVKVRKVMTTACFDKHPDDDAEEAREFGHQL